jgi:hypothetical protein
MTNKYLKIACSLTRQQQNNKRCNEEANEAKDKCGHVMHEVGDGQFRNLLCSHNIVKQNKSRMAKYLGHVVRRVGKREIDRTKLVSRA